MRWCWEVVQRTDVRRGGGKAGAARAVIERAEKIGKKILISGGGRCNFTNIHCTADNFISANPHFAKSALARYTPQDFIGLVEKHRIPYHEKTLGQLFAIAPRAISRSCWKKNAALWGFKHF